LQPEVWRGKIFATFLREKAQRVQPQLAAPKLIEGGMNAD
jgi:hypothetical protein